MCPGGASTTVSGTVYAPNGKLPLYNVAVYVPNAPLEPLSPGMTCDRCGTLASGRPIASALSDHQGKFRITNVPVGKDIPLVIQVGKWRRKVTIPEVKACQDNPLTDPQLTRLPRNRTEGDLPRVALTSGRCDQLTCMIPKLGLDPAEVGVAGQDRAFTFFSGADGDTTGGPPGMMPATSLWNSFDELSKYSMVLFSCPCNEARAARGPASARRRQPLPERGRPRVRQPLRIRLAPLLARSRAGRGVLDLGAATWARRRSCSTPASPRARRWPTG